MQSYSVSTDSGSYDITAHVQEIGNDLLVSVWGGEKTHIGAEAISEPRASLKDPKVTSASTSFFCCLGHKEDELTREMSNRLSSAMNRKVVVTMGIHWDDLSMSGIEQIVRNQQTLFGLIRSLFK